MLRLNARRLCPLHVSDAFKLRATATRGFLVVRFLAVNSSSFASVSRTTLTMASITFFARCRLLFLSFSFPTASNPWPADNGMEIVSLPLTGLPRPHPFAMKRGADAVEVRVRPPACTIFYLSTC